MENLYSNPPFYEENVYKIKNSEEWRLWCKYLLSHDKALEYAIPINCEIPTETEINKLRAEVFILIVSNKK